MFPDVVELNVGGVAYTTSLASLTRVPGSLLANIFNGKSAPVQDVRGRYFIDRDGILFRYILEFLRDGELRLPEHFQERERLQGEARFYGLGDIVTEPTPKLNGTALQGHREKPSHAIAAESQRGSNTGIITISYRGTFSFSGREATPDVKFRKLTRILICGRVALCRWVFGDTLNESRDPDRAPSDRYTSRYFLKHTVLEQAFEMLAEKGFRLVGCCGTGTSSTHLGCTQSLTGAASLLKGDEESKWNHYNEFVWQR